MCIRDRFIPVWDAVATTGSSSTSDVPEIFTRPFGGPRGGSQSISGPGQSHASAEPFTAFPQFWYGPSRANRFRDIGSQTEEPVGAPSQGEVQDCDLRSLIKRRLDALRGSGGNT